jgi:hexosaminidase
MQLAPMLNKHGKQFMGWEDFLSIVVCFVAIVHSWRGPNEGMVAGQS